MANVDIAATPIISVIGSQIQTTAYGIIHLVAYCSLMALKCQYTIAGSCYKAFLLLSILKLFQGTHTSSLFLNLSVLSHECMHTRVFFCYLTFYSGVYVWNYAKLNNNRILLIWLFTRNFRIEIFLR
jgi:hypothetical protein